jgi:hypothetical protein
VNSDQLLLSASDARVLDWSTVATQQRIRPAGCEAIELRYALGETAATGIARLALHADAQGAVIAPAHTVRCAPLPTAAPPPAPAPPPVAPPPPPPSRAELARAQRILEGQRRAAAAAVVRGQANQARYADALRIARAGADCFIRPRLTDIIAYVLNNVPAYMLGTRE